MGLNPGQKGLMAEINVTPFVDVMLVLLIIFMVTAPMLTQGLDVDLPKTRTVEALPTDSDHLVLSIKEDGSMALDEYDVTFENLQEQVKVNVADQDKQLFLRADKKVEYGVVVRAMGEIRAAGIDHLGMVAESSETNAPAEKPGEEAKPDESKPGASE